MTGEESHHTHTQIGLGNYFPLAWGNQLLRAGRGERGSGMPPPMAGLKDKQKFQVSLGDLIEPK